MSTATLPIGLITQSKNFLIMHAPMISCVREIMHEIILNQTQFVNIHLKKLVTSKKAHQLFTYYSLY